MPLKGHFWILKPDGSIYDPDFEEYSYIKRVNNCTDEKVYHPLNIKNYPLALAYAKADWKEVKKHGLADLFYMNPMPYQCNRNAQAYKRKHPECRLIFGSFGWKTKDGGEWLEFEAEDLTPSERLQNEALKITA